MKVFFDTNVLVSAYTTHGLSADLFRVVIGEHELLTGEVNLRELRRVLVRRFGVPVDEAALVERELREHSIVPKPRRALEIAIRDRDDVWVLASAVSGGADVLVTGDRDLLDVADEAPLPVLSPRDCWQRLRS